MKIISNFPKKDKKVKTDKSIDIFFAVTVFSLIGLVIAFCAMVQNVEAVPDLQPKPIISEIKEVKDIKPVLVTKSTAEKVIEKAMEEPTDISQTDEYLIASVVMAEEEGEPFLAKVACAVCILNRCDRWDLTVETVISSPNQFAQGKVPNEECIRASELAKTFQPLFDSRMIFFRNKHYHENYGIPYFSCGNTYFSIAED